MENKRKGLHLVKMWLNLHELEQLINSDNPEVIYRVILDIKSRGDIILK